MHSLATILGGDVIGAYVTTGQYDVVAKVVLPDGDAMAKFALSIGAPRQARTTTFGTFSHEEISEIVSSLS